MGQDLGGSAVVLQAPFMWQIAEIIILNQHFITYSKTATYE